MDILDLMKPHYKMPCSGEYYATDKAESQYFEYAIESMRSTAYGMLIQNIAATEKHLIIRTSWAFDWKERGFIRTQDGQLWQVSDFMTDVKRENENVLRILVEQPTQEYVISLIGVERV